MIGKDEIGMSVEAGPVERRIIIVSRLGLIFILAGLVLLCVPFLPWESATSLFMKRMGGGSQPELGKVIDGLRGGALATFYVGTVAPLWSLSLLMFIYAILMSQKMNLRAQKESFEVLKAHISEQKEIVSRQASQARGQNLLEMIRWHNEMVTTFQMTRGESENARIIHGKACLRVKYSEFVDEGYRRLFKDDEAFRVLYEEEIESVKKVLDAQEKGAVPGDTVMYEDTEGEVAGEDTPLLRSPFALGRRESRWEQIEEMREEAFNRALDEYFQESVREKEFIRRIYLEFYEANEDMLGKYFRSLRDILTYIDNSRLPDESFYVNMLKMQFSGEEIALLFYHVQAMDSEELRALVERYDLLEHLTYGLLHPRYRRLLGLSVRQG